MSRLSKKGGKTSEGATVLKTCEECSESTHTDTYFSGFLETIEIPPLLEKLPFLLLLSNSHPKASVLTSGDVPGMKQNVFERQHGRLRAINICAVQRSTNI